MVKEVGHKKREFTPVTPNATLMTESFKDFTAEARKVLAVNVKQDRSNATSALKKHIKESLKANPAKYGLTETSDFGKEAAKVTDEVLYKLMRADILNEEKRIAGRPVTKVREIETETSVLSGVHGSALFTRGETQVLAAVTIGGKQGEQMNDSIHGVA
jgi:polyribonucleotide nucleotidyltransferase